VVENIAVGYGGSSVLDDLSLVVREGEAVALLGRNGVGKTTTLRALTGSLAIGSGTMRFDGTDITAAKTYEINRLGISLV
ncbi:ATP-binding cassette domain-containing protein, partial [Stenotrophomonas maltophilia]|uniref:ATP-binding cassette domain-containing protein n=1 Tax=Stenotrophomonas maltophilia TaxID=40324 RepID=UPI0031B66FE2